MMDTMKRFSSSEEGSVIILVALSSMMLIAAAGSAIDMARAQTLQEKISSSLDAAGLAAGATASSVNPQTQASRYFNANFPSGYLGSGTVTVNTACADMSGNTVTCTSPSTYTINLTATTTQSTTFMKAVGINSLSVAAASQITRQTSGMELALVLDNTGSMASAISGSGDSVAKIDALQCATAGAEITSTAEGGKTCAQEGLVTQGLLDILYGGNETLPDLFVGVVPFSNQVNVGVTSSPGSSFVNNVTSGNTSHMTGCVDSRNPATASTYDTAANGFSLPSGDTIHLDISDDPPGGTAYFNGFFNSYRSGFTTVQGNAGGSDSDCPTSAITWMQTTKTNAVAAVQAMSPNGDTLLHIGLAWGWRMLSPNWNDSTNGSNGGWPSTPTFTIPNTSPAQTETLPLPYNTTHMLKVLVFMTDGMNNNGEGSSGDTRLSDYEGNVTGGSNSDNSYADQSYEPCDTTSATTGSAACTSASNMSLDQLTMDVCDAMKAKGIIIYVVAFGVQSTQNPPTGNRVASPSIYVDVPLLQYCATQEYAGDTSSHFFYAPNNAQLEAAFEQIGEQLANLRVSQ